MAITANKKIGAMINAAAASLSVMRVEMTRLNLVRSKFATHNPSATGTPLEGIKSALDTELSDLDTALNSVNFDTIVDSAGGGGVGTALD